MLEAILWLALCVVIIVVLLYFTSCPVFALNSMGESGPIGYVRYMNFTVPDNKTIIDNFASAMNTTVKEYGSEKDSILKFAVYFPLMKKYKIYNITAKFNDNKEANKEYDEYIKENAQGLSMEEMFKFTNLILIKAALTGSYK